MKNTMMKVTLAATMLVGGILGQGAVDDSKADAAAAPTTKAQPVMTDNLFKFGLKKDIELPVTVTAGGLSYTLEKLMFYDVKSTEAQTLMKKYGYSDRIYRTPTKYMVWTKLTIENKSNKIIQQGARDLSPKWRINVNGSSLDAPTPGKKVDELNNREALWDWVLKPGEQLSTYQMYGYIKDPKDISIYVNVNGQFQEKYIVNMPEE
ncbi:hypothetical protein [Paenibacillus sp. GCM10012306]|uniref:hypothetical protein n=1 Tax=Paenibacillus sp. GCM10012306 TaxID=3317342 RepID=UPI00360A00EA